MFFNGHTHTMYSNLRLLDSINKPKVLIDAAISMGLSGIAITDHESLGAHMEVNKYAKEIKEKYPNFTIALGNEIYLVDERSSKIKYYHFILIAKDSIGHKLLRELSSKAWYNSYTDRRMERVPLTKEELVSIIKNNKGHLIATTACLAGELPSLILELIEAEKTSDKKNIAEIKRKIANFIKFCLEIFGEDFYLECAPAETLEQIMVNKRILSISKAFGVKLTTATDAHYISEEDSYVHSAYLNSKGGERETESFYKYAKMMTEEQASKYLKSSFDDKTIKEIFENTEEIRKKIVFYSLEKTQIIPQINNLFDFPKVENKKLKDWETLSHLLQSDNLQERYWVNKCLTRLSKLKLFNKEYLDRLELEAKLIQEIGDKLGQCLYAYFNTFEHYINLFWECGSIVGPGRGSATGFLSNYLLDITQLDPIKWKLPYWRFLNEARAELPDIDIDLSPSKKPEILKAIREERGELGIVQVCTYGTEKTKNAILTACRGYRSKQYPNGIDVDTAQYLSSLVPVHRGFLWPLKDIVEGNEEEGRLPVKTFLKEVEKYPKLLDIMMGIEGLVNKRSSHASGVILYGDDPYETASFMRTPSGDLVTQFDLHMAESAGDTKYDFLVTEVLDKMSQCLLLLQEDGVIEKDSLKNLYNKYLHPDVLEIKSEKIWDALAEGSVLDTFQFSTGVGLAVAKKIKPRNPIEMTAANALMRLMSERGQESQQERFARIKEHGLHLFSNEMEGNNLTAEQQKVMHKHCDEYYGCVPFQEQMMEILMDKNIANFTLAEANNARKIVAKKLMSQIPVLKEQMYEKMSDKNFADYVWKIAIQPSLGYAFSLNHSLPYSFVGLQTLFLGTKFNPIYWNTACLIVNSGSINMENNSSTSYDKIAKAIGDIRSAGIEVSLIDINKSSFGFKPDAENNSILFGLKGIVGVGDEVIKKIIEKRPYSSLEDFIEKTHFDKTVMIALIKGGAFDKFSNRLINMGKYLWHICNKKKTITIANIGGMVELGMVPQEYDKQIRVYNFTKFLRKHKNSDNKVKLDNYCIDFVNRYNFDIAIDSDFYINLFEWEKIYEKEMNVFRNWISKNKEELIKELNKKIFKAEWDKYAEGTFSKWEMDALCFYYNEHELSNLNYSKYNISNFFELPEEPEIRRTFTTKDNYLVKLYSLSFICGTCIAKDKTKGTVSLLTREGVVNIKFPKEYFAIFDKQLSEQQENKDKKTVVEKSWFNRGNMIMVQGYRRGDDFIPKKYKTTGGHMLYKITGYNKEGDITITSERAI